MEPNLITLKKIILAGIKFQKFREFWLFREN